MVQPVGVGRGVERERLAQAGTRGDDDHLPRVQAVGGGVEIGEAGGDAATPAASVASISSRVGWQFLERDVVVTGAALDDVVIAAWARSGVGGVAALGAVVASCAMRVRPR
jgi:hypothetical protein